MSTPSRAFTLAPLGMALLCLVLGGSGALARAEVVGKATPRLPPGTLPLYVADPVLPANPADPRGFACFGACGASCNCVDRRDATTETCEGGQRCTWQTTSCRTHEFCRWHDTCYNRCDFQFPGHVGDGSASRFGCYRACDASCSTGKPAVPPTGAWDPAELAPGAPPHKLGPWMCLRRLANDPSVPYDGDMTFAALQACHPDPACGTAESMPTD